MEGQCLEAVHQRSNWFLLDLLKQPQALVGAWSTGSGVSRRLQRPFLRHAQ